MKFNFDLVFSWDTMLALLALGLSIIDLILHIKTFDRQSVSFSIRQDEREPAYNLGFVMFARYQMVFFRLTIVNLSFSPATIARFVLRCPDGTEAVPSHYTIKDPYNPNGLTLYERHDSNRGELYNLRSENLLDSMRFEPNGAASGYLVFFGVPPLESDSEEYTLHAYAGKKCFRVKLVASRLPPDLKPLHEGAALKSSI